MSLMALEQSQNARMQIELHSIERELPRLHVYWSEGRGPTVRSPCCGFIGSRCAVVVGNQMARRVELLLTASFVRSCVIRAPARTKSKVLRKKLDRVLAGIFGSETEK
jgi:hypothetical protein